MNISNAIGRTAVRNYRLLAAATIGLAVSGLLAAQAQAGEMRKPAEEMRSVYQVKYRVDGEARYAKKPKGKLIRISASQYRNSNRYLCTPSGFGQKSRCRAAVLPKGPDI